MKRSELVKLAKAQGIEIKGGLSRAKAPELEEALTKKLGMTPDEFSAKQEEGEKEKKDNKPEQPTIQQMILELAETGQYSKQDIRKVLFEKGIKTKSGKMIHYPYVYRVIKAANELREKHGQDPLVTPDARVKADTPEKIEKAANELAD